ncbi:uncharacterized protein N7477_006792 [Penicillium maclennaniae]|uniref:uncharacterized protein n=1 Tax=Penicillium maclennaniae TaxID=1343394 RepID=UPI002540C12F|nr:uncharacterized protein N7477_006792 [Penicillium maclennaniae]KAJ5668222.1 hypothetical protein N7477_006792 [Penicillium maclennaniae]
MPLAGTPSPFRLSRRQQSTRRSAGPQFANSPRFLLSQSTPQRNKDLDIEDDDDLNLTVPVGTRTPAPSRNAIPPRWQRDVIEDSDGGEPFGDIEPKDAEGTTLADDVIDSSLPEQAASPADLSTDFEAVFAPVPDSHKRRRLSGGHHSLEDKLDQETKTLSTSPVPQKATPDPLKTPASRVAPRPVGLDNDIQATPGVLARPTGPVPSTPRNTTTPYRSKPRFVLSNKKPLSSQTPFRAETPFATQPTPPPERRKPAFVLPREPSPDAAVENIPAPFSPSSRTLRRRGRGRAGVPVYTPGGMAAEVRSWILEMGSKHEGIAQSKHSETKNASSKYLVTARVVHVSPGTLSSSGPLTLIRAEIIEASEETEQERKFLNIMAMGSPRSQLCTSDGSHTGHFHISSVQEGDLVGIYRGLTWEMELHDGQALGATKDLALDGDSLNDINQRWLVVMKWDLLSEDP